MAVVYDKHLNIMNINELEEYVFKRLRSYYPHYYDYMLLKTEGNEMLAVVNDIPFSIIYERGKMASIAVRLEYRKEGKTLLENIRKVISPVMWYVDPSVAQKQNFLAPIISFEIDDCLYNEWDLINPIAKLKNFAFEYSCGVGFENIQIHYPGQTLESLEKSLKYGEYIDFLNNEEIEKLNNMKEMEVYYYIIMLCDRIDNFPKDDDSLSLNMELEKSYYVLSYLIQRTKEFGVKVDKPSLELRDVSVEFEAWLRWWKDGVANLTDSDIEKYKINETDFDPSFRPSGDFHNYIKLIEKERKIDSKDEDSLSGEQNK